MVPSPSHTLRDEMEPRNTWLVFRKPVRERRDPRPSKQSGWNKSRRTQAHPSRSGGRGRGGGRPIRGPGVPEAVREASKEEQSRWENLLHGIQITKERRRQPKRRTEEGSSKRSVQRKRQNKKITKKTSELGLEKSTQACDQRKHGWPRTWRWHSLRDRAGQPSFCRCSAARTSSSV